MNNFNRIKRILKAKNGLQLSNPENKRARFSKYSGSLVVYSDTGEQWYEDEALTKPYQGSTDNFRFDINYFESHYLPSSNPFTVDQNSLNGTKSITTVPGAAPVDPNSAVKDAADQNLKVKNETSAIQIKQQALSQASQLEPPKIEIKGLNTSPDTLKEASKGMNQINEWQQQEQQKKEKRDAIIGNISTGVNAAFQGTGAVFGAQQAATDSNTTKTANQLYNAATDTVEKMGPVGKVVGTALKNAAIAGDIIQGLGGGTDQMTSTDKWMDSSFFSWNVGMINGFGGKKADTFAADKDVLENVGSSYGGTSADIMDAASKSGKKYGMFSSGARKRANRTMAAARTKQNLMEDISDEATDQRLAVQSMGEQAGLAYSIMTDGGYNQKYTYAAKQGGTLEWNPEITLEWEPQIELNWELPAFKEGGTIKDSLDIPEIEETTQKNVIPEGALHKNKHHMEHAEGLTKKGIPVIDEEGEQQAEIELNEIIFTLEVTKKLEEYYEIFYSEDSTNKEKEQAALEAGKLLVYEILENTDDRTGLIESCKQGGSLTLKKSTDNLIEEALEWIPNIIVIEETIEEKPKKEKEKSEKEQMKEAIKEVLIELLTK